MSFSSGSLSLHESVLIAQVYQQKKDWSLTRKTVISENLLQARMINSAKRLVGELIPRLKTLDEDELAFFLSTTEQNQRNLLWLAICRRHGFIADFMREVVHERYVTLKESVEKDEYEYFWEQKSILHPELERISESTKQKLRTVLFKMLRDVGILRRDGGIQTMLLDQDMLRLIQSNNVEEIILFTTTDLSGRRI